MTLIRDLFTLLERQAESINESRPKQRILSTIDKITFEIANSNSLATIIDNERSCLMEDMVLAKINEVLDSRIKAMQEKSAELNSSYCSFDSVAVIKNFDIPENLKSVVSFAITNGFTDYKYVPPLLGFIQRNRSYVSRFVKGTFVSKGYEKYMDARMDALKRAEKLVKDKFESLKLDDTKEQSQEGQSNEFDLIKKFARKL